MLSHVIGSTDDPLLDITIGTALDLAADRWTDKIALIDRGQDVRLTWRELRERSDHLAAGFLALGLKTGDQVLAQLVFDAAFFEARFVELFAAL